MDKLQIAERLKTILEGVSEIKDRGVDLLDDAEFSAWKARTIKWLKLGLPYTEDELRDFQNLQFHVPRLRFDASLGGGGSTYDYEDIDQYNKDCDHTRHMLESAIENIEIGLVPTSTEAEGKKSTSKSSKFGGVTINQADNVVLGDSNTISIVDSITISDFLNILEKQIETRVDDDEERKSLLERLKKLSEHPLLKTVWEQTVGALLRGEFTQLP